MKTDWRVSLKVGDLIVINNDKCEVLGIDLEKAPYSVCLERVGTPSHISGVTKEQHRSYYDLDKLDWYKL